MNKAVDLFTSSAKLSILLIIIGILLAIDSVTNLSLIYKLWPLLIFILGVGFLGIFQTRSRKESGYLILGIVLICFSVIALYCNLFTWGAIARLWPLFPASLGLAFIIAFFLCRRQYFFILFGLLLLSIAGIFFFVFSISGNLWWVSFIFVGISILISEKAK